MPLTRFRILLLTSALLLLAASTALAASPPAGLPQVIGENDLLRVRRTNRFPYAAVVRLRNTYAHKTNACSGVLVASNIVLTAAHCLYDKVEDAHAGKVRVYPGKNGGYNAFGSVDARTWLVNPEYTTIPWSTSHEVDWAVVVLEEHVGLQTGWFELAALDADALSGQVAFLAGYPNGECGDCPFTGKNMHLGMGEIGFVGDRFFLHGIDSMHGSSGAGIFLRRGGRPVVVGIHSTSGDETYILNQAARVTAEILDVVAEEAGRYGALVRCPGAPAEDPCCRPGDPCARAGDGICQCQSCGWDQADCGAAQTTPRCTACEDDPECGEPFYCSSYAEFPEVSFCVSKCADGACPEGFYCTDKGTCWVSGADVCHYGHVWREDSCGHRYKLVEACHKGETCVAGNCLDDRAPCLLDGEEPDDGGPGPTLLPGQSRVRTLCPSTDEDAAVLAVPAPGTYRVETWGLWGDTWLEVRNGAGELAAVDDDGGDGAFSLLHLDLDGPAEYPVRVTGGLPSAVPRYALSFEAVDPCFPSCAGSVCGGDGCGGSCGLCAAGETCLFGRCVCAASCEPPECGINACGGDCGGCTGELALCLEGSCFCTPDCEGRSCGDDGCGGSCGDCAAGESCVGGLCLCVPSCAGSECGDDGCGGSCGACAGPGALCVDGSCLCQPQCGGRECGDDGCGGSCGACNTPQHHCVDGSCLCEPACTGRECGHDGCGGSCGTCPGDTLCQEGECRPPSPGCAPVCAAAECGTRDGCYCGGCPPGSYCNDGHCGPPVMAEPDVTEADVPPPESVGQGCGVATGPADAVLPSLLLLLLLSLWGRSFLRRW